MKKTYYLLPRDAYNQPSGDIVEIMLSEEEYERRRIYEYIYEDYASALRRALD